MLITFARVTRLVRALLAIQLQAKNAYDLALSIAIFADAVSAANDEF